MSSLQPLAQSSLTNNDGLMPTFDCDVTRSERDAVWIRLAGELDLVNASQLGQTLLSAIDGHRLVVVDLHGLTFMDSSGIHALVEANNRARRREARLVLIRGPAQVSRLLDLTGLTDHFEIVDPHGT